MQNTGVIDVCGGLYFLSKVAVLDPLVAQQVAAREVVDRPASVVKELSENALDAGATHVEVEIADGGRERMVVRDNGSGMSEEDAKLSVLSYATSKLRTVSDIESVMTMGFRGEALPSIARVSAFSLTTSTGEGAGTKVVTDGGGEATVSAASHPKGTTVQVVRLFYNVPARRAFLKSARVERAVIVDVMTNLPIAHPQVMFPSCREGPRCALPIHSQGPPGAPSPAPRCGQGQGDTTGGARVGGLQGFGLCGVAEHHRREPLGPDDLRKQSVG
jgi:DNA mismatch repair protein MutL